MNGVSQWWIGGLRTRKAKVAGSIPAGGSFKQVTSSMREDSYRDLMLSSFNSYFNNLVTIFLFGPPPR